jgi:hypothetical protein
VKLSTDLDRMQGEGLSAEAFLAADEARAAAEERKRYGVPDA